MRPTDIPLTAPLIDIARIIDTHLSRERDTDTEFVSRVALCFFGQVKNVNHVQLTSFIDNVMRPLLEYFPSIDVYLHTYNIVSFHNPRNLEKNVTLHVADSLNLIFSELRELPGVKIRNISITQDAKAADRSFRPLNFYLSHGDPWRNEGLSMFYFLRQLYSLETVTRLWEKSPSTGDRYQAVVYVRPDLLFESPLPVADTLDVIDEEHSKRILRPRTVFSPNFDVFGGMNDRFALGTPDVMSVYGYRKNDIDRFMGENPTKHLHAESYLAWVMKDSLIRCETLDFSFKRIRARIDK